MRRENAFKTFVKVRLDQEHQKKTPLFFRDENNPQMKIVIDKVLDVSPAASHKAGGQGMCYKCRVRGNDIELFEDGLDWFVAKEDLAALCNAD